MVIYTMRKTITINIAKPCHEDWNTMTPNAKGRHCAVCEKTVTDFTTTTDENIIKTLKSNTKLCGRFKKTQLNRELVLSRKEKNNYLSFVASSLFAFLSLGSQELIAQNHPQTTQNDTLIRPTVKGRIATSILPEVEIKGTITSHLDRLPLPAVNITIKGTDTSIQSDFDGNFTLKTKPNSTLVLSFIGFDTKEITASNLKNQHLNIILKEDMDALMETAVGYINPSYYKKRLRKENKEKRKAKRQQIKNGEIERTAVGKFLYNITNIFRSK